MTQNKLKLYTLITGGSEGIGKALAAECASRKMNLILAALPDTHLKETAQALRSEYRVDVIPIGIDLTEMEAPKKIWTFCRDKNLTVNILINNAGVAGSTFFEMASPDYIDLRIQLNIRALVMLTRLFLPELKKLERAYILNVSSMSAFYPIPFKSIYSASKAFVLNFSKAVREELKGSTVSVSILCPSGVRTNVQSFSRIDSHGAFGKLSQVPADAIAHFSLKKLLKGKKLIIPGHFNRLLYFLGRLLPERIKIRLLSQEFRKELITGKEKQL
jgi:uncharacterized protein